MSERIRVAVVFGGRSSEHSISCVSAGSVLRALDRERYEVVPVGITPAGRWVLAPDDADRLTIVDGDLPEVGEGTEVVLSADPGRRGLWVHPSGASPGGLREVDVVFPLLHGPWGEDGTLQGLLELAGIPYVGSGVFASAAAMDKWRMKAMFAAAGLPQARYELVGSRDWELRRAATLDRLRTLGGPVFVKPARAGSSRGITRVSTPQELPDAIEEARRHDPRVVVEAAVRDAREIEIGVLTDERGDPRTSVPAEIVVRGGHDFYDFEAKYLDDSAELLVPADLPGPVSERVREAAARAFEVLGCEGLARCDVFVRGDGEVVLNEINTLPGFTPISMFPRVWQASGMTYPQLVDHLVQDALRRGAGLR